MSEAGIQSNRGDGYQTLVAFDWALTVLSDQDYQWLEVDSVLWSVDDVVAGRVDGRIICCQCKKNQSQFKAWSIADLSDELRKVASLLVKEPKAIGCFYSRSNFGDLHALQEFSKNYPDEKTYQANLNKTHEPVDAKLRTLLSAHTPNLSTYAFLQRTEFSVSGTLDRMKTLLQERLRQLVSNPSSAYSALWTRLDELGMRVQTYRNRDADTQHRLTKQHLKDLLNQAGAMLTPTMNSSEVRASFKSTSAIGRNWQRDIRNQRVVSPVVNQIIAAIELKSRSILLSGLPGSGKTCVMLDLQDELELQATKRPDLLPLFIQSREFADVITSEDRQAQGLAEHWVEKVARMADEAHVVVVIDSLDVLSIAREHSVLTYFLAQIDRLLSISGITVVTACRDFDRRHDRRIAQRNWDKEFTCQPLNWDEAIAPLLKNLAIDPTICDKATRELICNPRELALFVELALQGGSFNVVTSQALAQRYLSTVVQGNSALGDVAMQAIESMAEEMLKLRSLAIPSQRFSASQEIKNALLSQNVLHNTQDGRLTFGHQTLLDVLVISSAVRKGVTLSEFIQGLPPVPFVRPSIRSFVAQLAEGDRREFRKQLRTALTGGAVFHIRRLIAECFAEQIPQEEDWSLIRDLKNHHRDVFQLIYAQAVRSEWSFFWFKHLVPILREDRDSDGLTAHAYWILRWKNDDPAAVLAFWTEVIELNGASNTQFSNSVAHAITQIDKQHAPLFAPVIEMLLKSPRDEYSFLGQAIAHCLRAGELNDKTLWDYIVGEVKDQDVFACQLDSKLHCGSHEFGESNNSFLLDRMMLSTVLLDLAMTSIEQWSKAIASKYGIHADGYSSHFLRETSFNDIHTDTLHGHRDSVRILMDAMEVAIAHHASTDCDWWRASRDRLCFSNEGALRYIGILACIANPTTNLDLISRLLSDKSFLESDLMYELGTLMNVAFIELKPAEQDAVSAAVLSAHQQIDGDARYRSQMLQMQAELILSIPSNLRPEAAQMVLDECEHLSWPLIRQPSIGMRGGVVRAPFSFEVFLGLGDASVRKLLSHYNGHSRNSFDDFLTGGEREVGAQLSEAASRHPIRFLNLLSNNWAWIGNRFCDDIMNGVANHLAYRFGNLQSNAGWKSFDEPDATSLVRKVLDELERHTAYWRHNKAASRAVQGCAHAIQNKEDLDRLIFLAVGFLVLREEQPMSGDGDRLVSVGMNMSRGNVAIALMVLAGQIEEKMISNSELLVPALKQLASDEDPAVRAVMLRHLAYLQSRQPTLGWQLFEHAMEGDATGLWEVAESCLYYAYHEQIGIVSPWLMRLYCEGEGKDLKTWGRISALSALSKRIEFSQFLADVKELRSNDAWSGASSVWTHPNNIQQHPEQCFSGLDAGLNAENQHAVFVAGKVANLFREQTPWISVPMALVRKCFSVMESNGGSKRADFFGIAGWLNASSQRDPEQALAATEIYLDYVSRVKPYVFDSENNLSQLLTRLFSEAEEREGADGGAMLRRTAAVQDALLALGVDGVSDWLKAAERP